MQLQPARQPLSHKLPYRGGTADWRKYCNDSGQMQLLVKEHILRCISQLHRNDTAPLHGAKPKRDATRVIPIYKGIIKRQQKKKDESKEIRSLTIKIEEPQKENINYF